MPEPPPANPALKCHAPAALRNREPIAAVLRDFLPESGNVLEIASGSGQHVVHFASAFPTFTWQPSDADPACLASIAAWSTEAALPNLRPPLRLDARDLPWPDVAASSFDAVVSINMIHIAPWSCCPSLMAGADAALEAGGFLLLYGPFKRDGRHSAPSNAAFDEQLRAKDPAFGVRDLADVRAAAAASGLVAEARIAMPANNLCLIFRKPGVSRESGAPRPAPPA